VKERFGERIRRKRTEQKLGLREFATKVGISPTYLSRIETSEEKAPPAEEVIRKMADPALNDSFDELMTLAGSRVRGRRSTSSRPTRRCRSSCAPSASGSCRRET
jgi:transcriptional regulator with XRE-family HTH domain